MTALLEYCFFIQYNSFTSHYVDAARTLVGSSAVYVTITKKEES